MQDELKILEEVKAKQEELEEEAKKKEEATKVNAVIKVIWWEMKFWKLKIKMYNNFIYVSDRLKMRKKNP